MAQKYWVIITAAGIGMRLRADIPKQYLLLTGKTILEHAVDCFLHEDLFAGIIIVLHPQDQHWQQLSLAKNPNIKTCLGGDIRTISVFNALKYLTKLAAKDDWVLIHDGVRPCLNKAELYSLINNLQNHPIGGLLAVKINDTIKRVSLDNKIIETVDRNNLWRAMTPQMFRFGLLYQAINNAIDNQLPITDDAMALESLGLQPMIVAGSSSNLKITYPEDLQLAEYFLSNKT